ncbi:hypothetical protein ACELLULO517_11740 [Acidisoma cellulosilytica]|uniref:Proteophosphoglycan ppg4 n=1 Tax=Acidisoma cellulosilyticum TaxID=2802395 RepID=A0A964E4F4_9PROT|nr:hypothetical protein [Acidisoma cellulosilyticum]MCB8880908.1 hypothetical protein [Acidisoma cellulosilyticum]
MRNIAYIALSSALLLSPLAATGALAQSATPGSNAPATVGVPAGSQSAKPSGTMMMSGPSSTMTPPSGQNDNVRKVSPDSMSAQTANPPGAQPGTGTGMGKTSGTAAGN